MLGLCTNAALWARHPAASCQIPCTQRPLVASSAARSSLLLALSPARSGVSHLIARRHTAGTCPQTSGAACRSALLLQGPAQPKCVRVPPRRIASFVRSRRTSTISPRQDSSRRGRLPESLLGHDARRRGQRDISYPRHGRGVRFSLWLFRAWSVAKRPPGSGEAAG